MTLAVVHARACKACTCSSVGSQPLHPEPAEGGCCSGARVAPAMQLVQGMNGHETHPASDDGTSARWLRWGLGVFLAIALFFLWTEHRAHLLGALPWLLLLACPVMHFLMHRRHGGRHQGGATGSTDANKEHEHSGHGCC